MLHADRWWHVYFVPLYVHFSSSLLQNTTHNKNIIVCIASIVLMKDFLWQLNNILFACNQLVCEPHTIKAIYVCKFKQNIRQYQ